MTREWRVLVAGEDGIVTARQQARETAKGLGFGAVDQSRVATAVSELTRNVVRYATGGRGEVVVRELEDGGRVGIEVVVTDEGPGIADVALALRDGYSTIGSMGMGLPGARRLMDDLSIDSAPGRGTTVTATKWRR